MSERFLFDRTHGKEHSSETRLIFLSEDIDRKLTESGGPADQMADAFRAFGVEEVHVARYRAAVDVFLRERPTELEKTTDGINFVPRFDYFGLRMHVPEDFARVERICESWKPRLGGTGMRPVRADDAALFEQALRDWPKGLNVGSEGLDRFLARLNRLQYALHDPIHVAQNISSGDRLNRYKERFDPDGTLFDKTQAKQFVSREYTNIEPVGNRWNREALFPYNPMSGEMTPDTKRNRQYAGIYRNEATMDSLVEDRLRPVLREEPALCAWLHNRVVQLTAILREFNARAADGRLGPLERESAPVRRVVESLMFVANAYFSAFDSTSEAERYLRETHTTLNRTVSGNFLTGPAMTRLDHLAVINETYAVLNGRDVKIHLFPSGERVAYATDVTQLITDPPISNRGLRLTADLFEAAAARGASGTELQENLYGLQYALERGNSDEEVRAAVNRINETAGSRLSEIDGRELFGVSAYVSVHDFSPERYLRALAVRKAIMDRIQRTRPEALNSLVTDVLYDTSATPGTRDFYELTGFGTVEQDDSGRWTVERKRSWDEIKNDTALGILALDMTRLSAADKKQVRLAYQSLGDGATGKLAELERAIEALKRLKKRQAMA